MLFQIHCSAPSPPFSRTPLPRTSPLSPNNPNPSAVPRRRGDLTSVFTDPNDDAHLAAELCPLHALHMLYTFQPRASTVYADRRGSDGSDLRTTCIGLARAMSNCISRGHIFSGYRACPRTQHYLPTSLYPARTVTCHSFSASAPFPCPARNKRDRYSLPTWSISISPIFIRPIHPNRRHSRSTA